MAETKSILLFGATGLIGTHILDAILEAQPPFQKVGVFTSAETAKSKSQRLEYLKSKDVQVHIGDFSNADDVSKAYTAGYDTIVSAFGRPIIDKQILLIELAEKTPTIKKYFPSEYGTDIEYGPQSKDEPPHQLKLRVRKYIQDAVKRLEYTYLVTGPFAEGYIDINRGDPGSGSIDVKAKKAVLLGDGKGRISLTTMPDVGGLLVAALRRPEVSKGQALKVNSFTTTPDEILAEYERQLGFKLDVEYTALDDLRKWEKEAYKEKGLGATGWILKRIWTEGGTLYDSRDNENIGFTTPETLQDVVARVIKKQTG